MPSKNDDIDKNGRYIVHRGPRFSVVCAVKENGQSPAKEFLEHLEAQDKGKLRQFMTLFLKIGQTGQIFNKEHFRHETGDIWTFKKHQHRIPCFRDGDCFVLTYGFVKKRDKWLHSELKTAVGIMNEDKTRILKSCKKGKSV